MSENRLTDYLDHMIEATKLASNYIEGMSKVDFMVDTRTQQAVIMNLIIIGEAATKLLNAHNDFLEQHANVPWRSMKGMRNRIAQGCADFSNLVTSGMLFMPDKLVHKSQMIVSLLAPNLQIGSTSHEAPASRNTAANRIY